MIKELLVEDGSTVQPGLAVLRIEVGGGAQPASEIEQPKTESKTSIPVVSEHSPVIEPRKVEAKPAAQMASTDVADLKKSIQSFTETSANVPASFGQPSRQETRVKMNRMRQRIAQRLKDAQNTYAMLTTFNEIDMRFSYLFTISCFKIYFNIAISSKCGIVTKMHFKRNIILN